LLTIAGLDSAAFHTSQSARTVLSEDCPFCAERAFSAPKLRQVHLIRLRLKSGTR